MIQIALSMLLLLQSPAKPTQFVELEPPATLSIQGGESAEVQVSLRILEGYHVQANPVEDQNLIPTTLSVEQQKDLDLGAPVYPKAQRFNLEGMGDLPTFNGGLLIRVPVNAKKSARPGLRSLKASLHYQPCDAHRCLAPRTFTFEVPVRIERGRAASSPRNLIPPPHREGRIFSNQEVPCD